MPPLNLVGDFAGAPISSPACWPRCTNRRTSGAVRSSTPPWSTAPPTCSRRSTACGERCLARRRGATCSTAVHPSTPSIGHRTTGAWPWARWSRVLRRAARPARARAADRQTARRRTVAGAARRCRCRRSRRGPARVDRACSRAATRASSRCWGCGRLPAPASRRARHVRRRRRRRQPGPAPRFSRTPARARPATADRGSTRTRWSRSGSTSPSPADDPSAAIHRTRRQSGVSAHIDLGGWRLGVGAWGLGEVSASLKRRSDAVPLAYHWISVSDAGRELHPVDRGDRRPERSRTSILTGVTWVTTRTVRLGVAREQLVPRDAAPAADGVEGLAAGRPRRRDGSQRERVRPALADLGEGVSLPLPERALAQVVDLAHVETELPRRPRRPSAAPGASAS